MNDRNDIEQTLRDHQPRIDPAVKRHVMDSFRRQRAGRGWRRAVAIAATLVLLLSVSFYAGRVSVSQEEPAPSASAAGATVPWCAAESDLL